MKFGRLLTWISAVAFLLYGGMCLGSSSMTYDFHRFGLERLRMLTGVLEVLGGVGLLVGLKWRPALVMASGGLSLLMLIAFAIRLRMGDNFLLCLPSLTLMLVNAYILRSAVRSSFAHVDAGQG